MRDGNRRRDLSGQRRTRAWLVVEGNEAFEVNRRLRAKYINEGALDRVDAAWNRFDDVAIEITPGPRWRSWCGAIFAGETADAMGGTTAEVWLPDD